jgi:rfaE bifunctional protein kinase chain/domain
MALTDLLDKLNKVRILVIGDMMLDHYIIGDVYRISPEAPVPVVHATRDTYMAGGAANVALNLANLGVKSSILGYRKNDEAGQRLTEILERHGVSELNMIETGDSPTIIKTRVVIRGQQLCRIDREAVRSAYKIDHHAAFKQAIESAIKNTDAIIISDYAKGVITQSLMDYILEVASNQPNLLVAVDPKPFSKLHYSGAGLITPNRTEALELAGLADIPGEPYPLEEVCRQIFDRFSPKVLVVTLGRDGMAICQPGQPIQALPTYAREVFDVSGAGDTVVATLTAALAAGADPLQASRLANIAAGCVVAHTGTAPIQLDELRNWVAQMEDQSPVEVK